MLDIKLLRDDVEQVAVRLKERGFTLDVAKFTKLEAQRKKLQTALQDIQGERNLRSKVIGQAKTSGENIESLLQEVDDLGDQLKSRETELEGVLEQLNALLSFVPNLPHESIPKGSDETGNVEMRRWGEVTTFDFKPLAHEELGKNLGGMDFNASAKISGARFVVLKNKLALLQRALAQFMLDTHVRKHGYEEVYVPYLVKADSLFASGQFPKLKEETFGLANDDLWLIPTAEVPVTNLVRDEILDEKSLPLKYVCHSPCFRREAGAYGKDTRGMMRQHQFEKVELVQVVKPEDSYAALEELTRHAEQILQLLKLPYRVITLCTGDIGFAAAKTYDLEVWLPGQERYREISSCSNDEDFQARRMQARMRTTDDKKPRLVHTLNGSGVAVGRALIAVMENYQTKDGRIVVPEALRPYMHGIEII